MNAMLTDEDLSRLLGEAAASYDVPAVSLEVPSEVPRPVWRRPRPLLGAAAAVAVATALLLQGGAGGGSPATQAFKSVRSAGGTAETGGTTGHGVPVPAAVPPAALRPAPANLPVAGPVVTGLTAHKAGAGTSVPAQDGARIVKTGSMSLVVDDGKVSTTVARLQTLVTGLRGYVSDSSSEEAGNHPTATVTVRVPVGSFEALVRQVRDLKVKVVSAQTSGQDVTATYADTQAQIQSLQAARSRFLTILSGARTIAETLTVQQRVDDVQEQIDRLKGQQRVLADQSDLGTLTLSVAEKADQVLATPTHSGWSKAWHDATHGFTSGVQALVARSGRALLVLLVGLALVLLGRPVWRLARRRLV